MGPLAAYQKLGDMVMRMSDEGLVDNVMRLINTNWSDENWWDATNGITMDMRAEVLMAEYCDRFSVSVRSFLSGDLRELMSPPGRCLPLDDLWEAEARELIQQSKNLRTSMQTLGFIPDIDLVSTLIRKLAECATDIGILRGRGRKTLVSSLEIEDEIESLAHTGMEAFSRLPPPG